jgi:hypothetical protein
MTFQSSLGAIRRAREDIRVGSPLVWFRRLSEVPGINYPGSPGVDRRRLPGHDATPVVTRTYEWEGERHDVVEWRWPGGSAAGPPAREHCLTSEDGATSEELVRNLYEVLELPGEVTDYHFAIQSCAAELWAQRRAQPELLETAEELWLLDIRLVEAMPSAFATESLAGVTWYSVAAYESLISLYERQGYIREALAVTDRARSIGHGGQARERLEAKLRALVEEEGGG